MPKTTRFPLLLALLVLLAAPLHASSVTVAWDANTEPDIAGYVVFYGTQSGVYPFSTAVGNVTSYTVDNLTPGQTYYFAVQAVSATGLTSPLSQEVSTTIPGLATPPSLSGISTTATSFSPAVPVTWKASVSTGASGLEYRFWLFDQVANTWTTIQDYGPSDEVRWTPTAPGTYVIQVWVRRVGVTATYEDWKSSDFFVVAGPRPQIVSFTTDRTFPVVPGTAVRVTAAAQGGSRPMQYKFYVYSESANTWTVLQDYGPSNTTVWTPTAEGRYALQVWVRNSDLTVPYEAWRGLGWLEVEGSIKITSVTPNVGLPVTRHTPVTWSVAAGGSAEPIHYQYWLYNFTTGVWQLLQAYTDSSQLVWTPTEAGTFVLQVWARSARSTLAYQAWRNSQVFTISSETILITSFGANRTFPVMAGTPVTLSLAATGGSGALEYQFWLYRMATQTWTVLQPYSTLNQVVWTPAVQGDYVVQAWVRSQGSPAAYEAWQSSSVLRVSSGTVAVTSLVANQALPAAAGTPITWTATATAGGEVEYLFWQYDFTTANWTLLQAYGPSNSVTWTPAAGRYAIQVWVREVGATGPYDAWKTTDALVITPVGVP